MNASPEFLDALNALDQAWANFELAGRDHIDAAIYDIQAAQVRLDNAIRSAKGGEINAG